VAVKRCLVDTNVLLRALDRQHQLCSAARRAMINLRRQNYDLYLTAQNLIEFWAVATRPVDANGLGMSTQWSAAQLTRMKRFFSILSDTGDIVTEWERIVIQQEVSGKKAHDARLVASMKVHGITEILTFNGADFSRYLGITIIDPQKLSSVDK
jgi:predicted nucleic acid-binding protein